MPPKLYYTGNQSVVDPAAILQARMRILGEWFFIVHSQVGCVYWRQVGEWDDFKVAKLHLLFRFLSLIRILFFLNRALACLDIYPNIDRIRKVKCPVMIIHGRLDEEVDVAHGVAMHKAVPNHLKRDPWWVPDRGHNDITEGPGKLAEYIGRLRNFLSTLET